MLDMVDVESLSNFNVQYPNISAVCYINSMPEVNLEFGICCTSSNAINIVKNLKMEKRGCV